MGQHIPILSGRKPDPSIIRQINKAITSLEEAKEEYVETALPNILMEARLRQTRHLITSIQRDLDF